MKLKLNTFYTTRQRKFFSFPYEDKLDSYYCLIYWTNNDMLRFTIVDKDDDYSDWKEMNTLDKRYKEEMISQIWSMG